ncbi:MAG: serine/threonine protein kinase [Lachnospiraceae bacterium]|nr:serine/threonine protein kinase [Lachnospiraceae bacterium]
MDKEVIEKEFINYIKDNEGIETPFGKLKFTQSNRIGQGGNGLVYLSELNDKKVAIKFLITDNNKKIIRFRAEYFNTNYVKNELCNIVNMINYGELTIQKDIVIPYIIMSLYKENLKKYSKDITEVTEDEFECLLNFLMITLKLIHRKGIIHRDIKPENILIVKDKKFVLSDFGIAHYDKENFPIDNKTKKGERLANVEFSAPEQINGQYKVTKTADIYSMAQIMYWFVFGKVNRGTGAESISQHCKWKMAYIYDRMIEKCLRNNPAERFQTIEEIEQFLEDEKEKMKEVDIFDDMYTFHDAILSVIPEFYNRPFKITDKEDMNQLFESIFSKKYNKELEFNTGKGNNSISSIIKLENNDFLMEYRQLNIRCIWGLLSDDIYDDILLLELDKSLPYEINGEKYNLVAVVENDEILPYEAIASGFVRYKGNVYPTSELKIQERYVGNDYNIIAIAPFHSCAIIKKNDKFMEELQNVQKLQEEDIYTFKENIHRNRTRDVSMRL